MSEVINYSIQEYEGVKIIEASGNLTRNTCKNFYAIIQRVVEKNSLMIDMSEIKIITSSGLETIAELSWEARQHDNRLVLLWPGEDLLEMADTLELIEYFTIATSYEEGATKISYFT